MYGKLLLIRGTGAATYYTSFCGKGIDKGGVASKLKNLQKIFGSNKLIGDTCTSYVKNGQPSYQREQKYFLIIDTFVS
jgi:hypothetical protein